MLWLLIKLGLYNVTIYITRFYSIFTALSVSSHSPLISFYLIIPLSSQRHVHSHKAAHVHTWWSGPSQSNAATSLISISHSLLCPRFLPPTPAIAPCLLFTLVWLMEGRIHPFLRHSALLRPQSPSILLSYLLSPDGSPPASSSQQKLQLPFMSNKGKLAQQTHSALTYKREHAHTHTHTHTQMR